MRATVKNQIPLITADLISAAAVIGALNASQGLRKLCAVVHAIADQGRAVDDLTVGELLALIKEVPVHGR